MATATSNPTPKTGNLSPIARQQAIENALSMALFHVRHTGSESINLHAATAKANRALTLLKHACESATTATAGLKP